MLKPGRKTIMLIGPVMPMMALVCLMQFGAFPTFFFVVAACFCGVDVGVFLETALALLSGMTAKRKTDAHTFWVFHAAQVFLR